MWHRAREHSVGSSSTVTITDPEADAGDDLTIIPGQTATLDGSDSSDDDGHALSFSWSDGSTEVGTGASLDIGPLNAGTYTYELSVDDGFGGTDTTTVTVTIDPIPVLFDVKPDDTNNRINSRNKGVIPTAILGSADFDVSSVDVSTLVFGPGNATEAHNRGHLEDVNGDGYMDLVLHWRTQDSGLVKGDTEACVTGLTNDGWEIEGCDMVDVFK